MRLTRLAAVSAAVIALLAALVAGGAPASAHATLVKSDPADGRRVTGPLERVTLTFSDRLTRIGTTIRVTGPDGDATDGKPTVQGDTITQPLRSGLVAGDYEVRWQVASGDGHPVSKSISFTLAEGSAAPPEPSAVAPPETKTPQATATVLADSRTGAATDEGGGTPAVVWIGALLALALIGGLAAWVSFRRSR